MNQSDYCLSVEHTPAAVLMSEMTESKDGNYLHVTMKRHRTENSGVVGDTRQSTQDDKEEA